MSDCQHSAERLAEAARYALLRRLAPALRHNLAGALQPISMMSAMLEKRLQKPGPDMEVVIKNGSALNSLSREAALSCMGLMTWVAPKENESVAVNQGLEDAVGLIATELSFRGISLVNKVADVSVEVPRGVLRNAFMGALIALTDAGPAPATAVLTSNASGDEVLIAIALEPAEGEATPDSAAGYRKLDWDDVAVLAKAESVAVTHSPSRVELRYRMG